MIFVIIFDRPPSERFQIRRTHASIHTEGCFKTNYENHETHW